MRNTVTDVTEKEHRWVEKSRLIGNLTGRRFFKSEENTRPTGLYFPPCSDLCPKAIATIRGIKSRQSEGTFNQRHGCTQALGNNIRPWLTFCKEMGSPLLFHGVFRSNVTKEQVDTLLTLYVSWLKDPVSTKRPLRPTMARPLLCTAILWNRIFGQEKAIGTKAWDKVKEIEKFHLKGEQTRLLKQEYANLFRDLRTRFQELEPPFSRNGTGNAQFRDLAGIFTAILTCILCYRAGNVLNPQVKSLEAEAPLEELISFHPNPQKPSRIIFTTSEKTCKETGKIIRKPRKVIWLVNRDRAILDPLRVIDKYLHAMGQTRQSMRGPIVKPMGSGKTWKLKPFSTKNYASWLGNLTKRGTVRSLDSLGGVSLNTRIMRRTCLSYIASIASIEQAQALAGHACIGTTANYYVGFKDDELAEVRVAHSLRLLGSIPSLFF